MSLDAFTNFAISTLTAGITSGATSLTVQTGDGAKFPAVPFNAVLWNSTDYGAADLDPNREIVRVTANASDVFTITRAQESTTGVAHNTAAKTYSVIAGITALSANKLFDKTGDTMTGILKALAGLACGVSATKTAAATLTTAETFIIFDSVGGTFTLTLPAASAGKTVYFVVGIAASGTNSVTLAAAGADTIQVGSASAATTTLTVNTKQAFVSDGTSKWIRFV